MLSAADVSWRSGLVSVRARSSPTSRATPAAPTAAIQRAEFVRRRKACSAGVKSGGLRTVRIVPIRSPSISSGSPSASIPAGASVPGGVWDETGITTTPSASARPKSSHLRLLLGAKRRSGLKPGGSPWSEDPGRMRIFPKPAGIRSKIPSHEPLDW